MARQPRTAQPVTQHPLFPGIVALWFGALFGIGSLVIGSGLIEAAVLATGLDTVIAAAAPPLGLTARILLALGLAAAGGTLGAAIARRLARPKAEPRQRKRGAAPAPEVRQRARDAHPDAPARRPISAHDEIAVEGLTAGSPAFAGRRRALTIAEDTGGDRFHDHAPLPGGHPQVFDLAGLDQVEPEPPEPEAALELGQYEPLPAAEFEACEAVVEPAEFAPRQVFQPEPAFEPAAPAACEETPSPLPVPSAFAAPVAPPIDFSRPLEPVPAASVPAPDAPLGDLDLLALTERFAAALRQRREQMEVEPAAAVEPYHEAEPEEPVAVVPEPDLAVPPAPMALPAALRPVGYDDPDDGEFDDYSSLLPLRNIAMPVPVAAPETPEPVALAEPEDEAAPEIDEAEGYSSLLALGAPAAPRQTFVRIEEPAADDRAIEPVVIFPGQAARQGAPAPFAAPLDEAAPEAAALRRFDAPGSAQPGQPVAVQAVTPLQDPEETERALRAALATLQRMSGAA